MLEEAQGAGGELVRLTADVEVAGRQLQRRRAPATARSTPSSKALAEATGETIRVLDYHEHAIGSGADAQAVAYLELRVGERTLFGVGMDANIVSASLKAIVSGLQRARPQATGTRRRSTWQTN